MGQGNRNMNARADHVGALETMVVRSWLDHVATGGFSGEGFNTRPHSSSFSDRLTAANIAPVSVCLKKDGAHTQW